MIPKIAYRIIIAYTLVPFAGLPFTAKAQDLQKAPAVAPATGVEWKSTEARHVYGLPDSKPNKKGTLTLDATALTFTGESSNASIPRTSITAVSAGNDRIELWGTGGRLMRMAIPEGGGMAAATVMHHRVDMLTVEFSDAHGGMHSALFYLPATEADHALQSFVKEPLTPRKPIEEGCGNNPVDPRSVFVEIPNWDKVEVPAAYRSLVYEHVIDRLKATKEIGHVYRYGEVGHAASCPQYTIKIAIEGYKKGNQVVRAATGPIGMFTSATQMTFNVTYSDASTGVTKSEEIKASVRTESESTGVADSVAKKLAKQYGAILKTSATPATVPPKEATHP